MLCNSSNKLKIAIDKSTDYFVMSDNPGLKTWERYESDAGLIYFRKGSDNKLQKAFLLNGSFLSFGKEIMLTSQDRSDTSSVQFADIAR